MIAVAGSGLGVSPARADPGSATADRLFEEGRVLAKVGRFKEACQRFAQSDLLQHTFGTAVNLGDCAERDGHLALAWQLFDDAARTAERTSSHELAKFARDRAAALAPRLCTVVVRVADPALAGLTILVGDRTVPPAAEVGTLIEPGEVSVAISAASSAPMHRVLTCAAGAITFVQFPEIAPPVEPVGPATVAAEDASIVRGRRDAVDPHATTAGHGLRVLSVVTGSLGAVALSVGIGFGVSAKGIQSDAHHLCPSEQLDCVYASTANSLIRRGHTRATVANVAFGVSAAAAIASGVLWYVGGRRASHGVAVAPAVSPDQLALTALGSF